MITVAGSLVVNSTAPAQVRTAEDFSAEPQVRGWRSHGNAALFHWNATNRNLEVTWDSREPNSYFYHPLRTVLTKTDDFAFSFDLQLRDLAVGVTPGKPYTFQLAIGFLNHAQAISTNFLRGSGFDSPNLVEFNYFPDSGFGATVSTVLISSNHDFGTSFNFPLEMTTNDWFQVALTYTASNQTLVTLMTRNGEPFGPIQDAVLDTNFTDFRVDTVAIASYSDAGQDPDFGGSILAHGVVDNVVFTVPEPPISQISGAFSNQVWQTAFTSYTNWVYYLEGSADLKTWNGVTNAVGTGSALRLQDGSTGETRFYRIRAERL